MDLKDRKKNRLFKLRGNLINKEQVSSLFVLKEGDKMKIGIIILRAIVMILEESLGNQE